MTTITVWLLITVGGYNANEVVVVDRFPDAEQCEHVRKAIPFWTEGKRKETRCIEAKVVRP